jgi:hypothetical protein
MRRLLFAACFVALAVYSAPPRVLAIRNVALSQYDDGPGVTTASYFVPGETVFVSFQVAGYTPEGDDEQAIRLEWKVDAADPAGKPIVPPESGKVAAALTQEDKNWMPKIRHTVQVPPFAPPGVYRIALWVKDNVAGTEVRAEAQFAVRARVVEPSAKLAVGNVAFYRGEDDKAPLSVVAYKPGDTVWIRFDIVGFKLGEGNAYDTGYGVAVLRPNGETLFEQKEAAGERDRSFYPRTYLPAGLSLNLTADLAPGEYTAVITASDKTGTQTAEARVTFRVEK